jgi:hypothetical protein
MKIRWAYRLSQNSEAGVSPVRGDIVVDDSLRRWVAATGFFGWPSVDADGRLDIGFPGPSSGQMTVDWVRWGNGVILDPTNPDATPGTTLSMARVAGGVRISWTGGGTLQSADNL